MIKVILIPENEFTVLIIKDQKSVGVYRRWRKNSNGRMYLIVDSLTEINKTMLPVQIMLL